MEIKTERPSALIPEPIHNTRDHTRTQCLQRPNDETELAYKKIKPFPFRELPLELRLRVLQHTHLGPPEIGDYDPRFESLIIRDGRLIPGIYDFAMRESHTEW